MRVTRKTKPSAKRRSKEAVRIVGGREICSQTPAGREEYKRRRAERWVLDNGICCLCGRFIPLSIATTEHPGGRGMGGSKRDDRVEAIRIACYLGNMAKDSMSLERYLELPLAVRIANCRGTGGGMAARVQAMRESEEE
jgi:hypothetical protein